VHDKRVPFQIFGGQAFSCSPGMMAWCDDDQFVFQNLFYDQLFPDKINKSNFIVFLQSLDSFCDRRLSNEQFLRGNTQVAVPGGVIENLQLVEIHLIITFYNQNDPKY
jgi:hypothetical protein